MELMMRGELRGHLVVETRDPARVVEATGTEVGGQGGPVGVGAVIGVVDRGEDVQTALDKLPRLVVFRCGEGEIGAGVERVRMRLWIVQSHGDRLGLTRGHLCLLRMADRAGDERAGSCTAVGSPELERAAAPLLDLLALDLLLPTDGGLAGGLGIQLLERRLVR